MHYIFDVDGTLSFDGRSIAPAIQAALGELNRQQPVWFASARPIRDLLPIVPHLEQSVLIGANGAMVMQDDQINVTAPISTADYQVVRELIVAEKLDYVVDGRWNLAARVAPNNPILQQLDPARQAQRLNLNQIDEPVKIILLDLDSAQQRRLQKALSEQTDLEIVVHAGEGNLDLTAKAINKFTTLQQLGVTEYVAFGNDQNDHQLLSHATTSVWVQSKPELTALGGNFDIQCSPEQVATMIRQFII